MKFGYINSKDWQLNNSKSFSVNIGEYIQFFATHSFLRNIGISEEMIIGASLDEWMEYKGEEVILVVSNITTDEFVLLSNKFDVVNFGVENFGQRIKDKDRVESFLKERNSYIGCRDEYIYNELIDIYNNEYLYINGCITVTLPRKTDDLGKDVYLVDLPIELLEFIPDEIIKNAKIKTHEYYYYENIPAKEEIEKISMEQYKEYYQKARLVITSRLHLAAPCIAWGIPVILIRKNPYITFSWIDKFLPIYTPDQYGSINWNPGRLDIEEYKKIIIRDMTYILMDKYYQKQRMLDVHKLYYDYRPYKPRNGYYNELIDGLKEILCKDFSRDDKAEYAIWGITFNAESLFLYLKNEFPNFKLKYAIDRYKRMNFNGIDTISPDDITDELDGKIVFVIPTGAVQEARFCFKNKACKQVYYVAEIFITEQDIKDEIGGRFL